MSRDETAGPDRRAVVTFWTGNEGVQTAEEIAAILEKVARRIRLNWTEGKIMDENGNGIGSFSIAVPKTSRVWTAAEILEREA